MIEWATPRQLGRLADFAHHALAQAALAAGDFEECYAHTTAITPPGTFRSHSLQALWTALDLIDAAVHTGRDDEARAHAEAARRADLGRLSPRFALVTAAARAMVASGGHGSPPADRRSQPDRGSCRGRTRVGSAGRRRRLAVVVSRLPVGPGRASRQLP